MPKTLVEEVFVLSGVPIVTFVESVHFESLKVSQDTRVKTSPKLAIRQVSCMG